MTSQIVVNPAFEGTLPFAAERFRELWEAEGPVEFTRLDHGDDRCLCEVLETPADVTRLVSLEVPVSGECPERFENLDEAVVRLHNWDNEAEIHDRFRSMGVSVYDHEDVGFFGQSVSEFALALTLCGLRRIPQQHREIIDSHEPWQHEPEGKPGPRRKGGQMADALDMTSGVVADKTVRVVGVGNIGSRYASFVDHLGADVAAYDPYADEPCFHRSGARRERSLDDLLADAEVFAALVPPTDETVGMIDEERVNALPEGCLVVLATRARIVDGDALRERVLADELALAADVWDENPEEPVPLDDDYLGRHNVVHTPHIAGRTQYSNEKWAERLADKFE